ncbi:MAG TPA: type II secretion system F family protein [Acidimicrobiales bacterium]|nr:type II secretion system F family protein [Acidimicrobiales bacterium]
MTTGAPLLAFVVVGAWAAGRAALARARRRLPTPPGPAPRRAAPAVPLLARLGRARTWRRFDECLPDAVAAVARGLRSGASLRGALADAAAASPEPVAAPLREVLAAADAGMPLADALDGWAHRCPRPNVLLLVAALSLAHETGGASAQAVDGVAATLRRRQAARAEAVALATQARTSAYVLAAVPLVACLVALLAGGTSVRFLLGTPVGLACLLGGLALEAVGAWWMARLTRAVVPAGARR